MNDVGIGTIDFLDKNRKKNAYLTDLYCREVRSYRQRES